MKLFSPIRSFFRTVVMVHKIVYVRHFNRARKQKKWSVYYISRRAYGFAILPNLVLLWGTALAPVGSDGQMQPSAHVWQSVVEYTLTGWAFLFMAIPILFDGTHGSLQREVRQELRERPRYWKRAVAVYWAAIVAAVVAMNVVFSVSEGIGSTAKRKAWKEKFIERFNDKRNIEAGGVVPPTGFKSKPTLACK